MYCRVTFVQTPASFRPTVLACCCQHLVSLCHLHAEQHSAAGAESSLAGAEQEWSDAMKTLEDKLHVWHSLHMSVCLSVRPFICPSVRLLVCHAL